MVQAADFQVETDMFEIIFILFGRENRGSNVDESGEPPVHGRGQNEDQVSAGPAGVPGFGGDAGHKERCLRGSGRKNGPYEKTRGSKS